MGRPGAADERPAPYGVVWRRIGNGVCGKWQPGQPYVGQFVLEHNAFARAMRAVDPGIKLVASGATPFEFRIERGERASGDRAQRHGLHHSPAAPVGHPKSSTRRYRANASSSPGTTSPAGPAST